MNGLSKKKVAVSLACLLLGALPLFFVPIFKFPEIIFVTGAFLYVGTMVWVW